MICDLEANLSWKFKISAFWYSVDQEFHAYDKHALEFLVSNFQLDLQTSTFDLESTVMHSDDQTFSAQRKNPCFARKLNSP
jgi:hypothetical protein